jgi:hypothetical protein
LLQQYVERAMTFADEVNTQKQRQLHSGVL